MIFAAWGHAARARGATGGSLLANGGNVAHANETTLGHAGPGFDLRVRAAPDGLDAERPGLSHAFFVAPLGAEGGIAASSLRALVAELPRVRADTDVLARFVAGEPLAKSLETVYRGVVRVRGAKALHVREGRVEERSTRTLR